MAPKKTSAATGGSRGNQRTTKATKASPQIAEHTNLLLFEKLMLEDFNVEDILDELKDVDDPEMREDLLQNFCVLLFKLVGLNSFVGKLEGKSAASIDEAFLKGEIEDHVEGIIDFTWPFTAPKEEHAFLKNNIYNFLGTLFLQPAYLKNPRNSLEQKCFFEEISRILVVLSKSRLMKVRQNCVRLTRIFVEQAIGRVEKLRNAALRRLDEDEKIALKNLDTILAILTRQILCTRVADKYSDVSSDALAALDVFFMMSNTTPIDNECLRLLTQLLDAPQSLSEDVLGLLMKIDWTRNADTTKALAKLFENPGFRQRIIFFTNTTSLAVSLRAIQLVSIFDASNPNQSFADPELIKIMASVLHPYEEVRREGLKIFLKFLNIHENESQVLRINLEEQDSQNATVQSVFPFKGLTSKLIDIQHRVYQVLNQIDNRLWEKEQLVENLIESLAFELGPLYDFSSIFKLLVKLPESDLGDTKYQFLKLMVLLLRKTMGVLSKIHTASTAATASSIPAFTNRFTKVQQERLLLIKQEFFANLLANSNALARIMREDAIFKEQIALLILAIPPEDLSENLKESTFNPFAKSLAQIISITLTNPPNLSQANNVNKSNQSVPANQSRNNISNNEQYASISLVSTMFALLQYCLKHVSRAYREPFQNCKEEVIKECIVEGTSRVHRMIVVGDNSDQSDGNSSTDSIHRMYFSHVLTRVCACAEILSDVPVLYREDFVQQWLEITDQVFDGSSLSCLFNYTTLSQQLSLYSHLLTHGLAHNSGEPEKLKAYLRYRTKLLRQTWLFLREDKRKTLQFNLEVSEAKRILRKCFATAIEAINFVSNKRLSHISLLHIQLASDDAIFTAMTEYISELDYFKTNSNETSKAQNNNNNNIANQSSNMVMQVEEQENEDNSNDVSKNNNNNTTDANKDQLAKINSAFTAAADRRELQEIIECVCSLTSHNPLYHASTVGVYVLKNFNSSSLSNMKPIVELVRKNFASCRLEGKKSSGFTPFWKAFDLTMEEILAKQEKGLEDAKVFIQFANRAYFIDSYATADGEPMSAKRNFRELAERQIYYLTAKLKDLLDNPSKIASLEALAFLIQIRVSFPKNLLPDDAIFIGEYRKKYHTLFLKKVQDFILDFKANNVHLASFNDTILSERNKNIVYRYVNALEAWSGVKFDVDPYGDGIDHLNESKAEAEKSSRVDRTPIGKSNKKEEVDQDEDDNENEEEVEEEVVEVQGKGSNKRRNYKQKSSKQKDDSEEEERREEDEEDTKETRDSSKEKQRKKNNKSAGTTTTNQRRSNRNNANVMENEDENEIPAAAPNRRGVEQISKKTKKSDLSTEITKQPTTKTSQTNKKQQQPIKRSERRQTLKPKN